MTKLLRLCMGGTIDAAKLEISSDQSPPLTPSLFPKTGGLLALAVFLGLGLPFSSFAQGGGITRQVWLNIPGTKVADLRADSRFPNNPTETSVITDFFEAPVNVADNYGQRLVGYLIPPLTGSYSFWIASDDTSELYISTDESPANERRVALVNGWTTPRDWTREATQKSTTSVALEANRVYYVYAIQKEGTGDDNLSIRWLRPDGIDEGPIPASYFMPLSTTFAGPNITLQPQSASVTENDMVTFEVKVAANSPAIAQWQRNGTDLAGGTGYTLRYGPVALADHNAQFRAVLTNKWGATTSVAATLSVTPDTTRPVIQEVINQGLTSLRVVFSERVDAATATSLANYTLSGGVTITGATLLPDERTVALTTGALIPANNYTLTVSSVRDRSATPNVIEANSAKTFAVSEYTPRDVGSGRGQTVTVPGGFDISASGLDIGRTNSFHFAYQEKTGNFDMRVRVARMTVTDSYCQAGLVATETLDSNTRFAGAFVGSAQLGAFFEARGSVGTAESGQAGPIGGFPANYPHAWLRLQRSGNVFTAYASFDGKAWQSLGSTNLALPNQVYFGMGVASQYTNRTAFAQFRDIGPVQSPTTFTHVAKREPLGPSNRRTGMIFSEIMYHPPDRADGKDLEFVEIYNGETIFWDLGEWRLTGGIEYTFPKGFKLEAGAFVVVAADPAAVESVYGIQGVLGPYSGRLNNSGDVVRLRNHSNALRLEVEYGTDGPWPAAADGTGHSLVLAKPSYGENDSRAWAASQLAGGSPGDVDPYYPTVGEGIVFNEVFANTTPPAVDYVELYNTTAAPIDLSGCFLSDDPSTNKYQIRAGTILQPRTALAYDQNELGFALSSAGETLYLWSADRSRVLDCIRFGAQENGVSLGLTPDGEGEMRRLQAITRGLSNSGRRSEDVVINELMYHPLSEDDADQYIELHNRSNNNIDLSGWRFTAGVDYIFPSGATLPGGGYVVVAKDAARLLTNYAQLNFNNTFGNFDGRLNNSGERVALGKPEKSVTTNAFNVVVTNIVYATVTEVTYRDGGRWPVYADGGGSSLELTDPRADLLQAGSWAASDETQKSPAKTYEFTGPLDNGSGAYPANRLFMITFGAGEWLVDDVEFFRVGSTNIVNNPGFETGATGWFFLGTHSRSFVETANPISESSSLHVVAVGDGDTSQNVVRNNLRATMTTASTTATLRVKAKWLAGFPEMLLRVRGNWIELPIRIDIPKNLGTPGLVNSRRVQNAPPAISEVAHFPVLPRTSEAVRISARVTDPDGATVRLRYVIGTTTNSVAMVDDGTAGDLVAGNGVYSAMIPGQAANALVPFWIEATDLAPTASSTTFPKETAGWLQPNTFASSNPCLVRWNDTVPFGSMAHYHLWNTTLNTARAYDNTFRDCTLVYGSWRVIYNAGYRTKGSPYHSGQGDFAATVPRDELLLGTDDRVFGSTGNGSSEGTGMLTDVAGWVGSQMGIPFLHSHYMRLYRNGALFNNSVVYDMEQPSRNFAEDWFGGGSNDDDFYKIAIWFEFDDSNSGFNATQATIERFLSQNRLKTTRYRWNWQPRAGGNTANDYQPILNMVTAANNTADRVTPLLNVANMEQIYRNHVFNRVVGNWDAWTFNVGQNMFIYAPLGGRIVAMPWDIDFVLGLGNGSSDPIIADGQDPIGNILHKLPAFRRMVWRAWIDALDGPMLAQNYEPQFDARRAMLLKNNVTGVSAPTGGKTFLAGRRTYAQGQLRNTDTLNFAIASNGGNDFSTNQSTVTLTGSAPFAVATIEINGIPYPITWGGPTVSPTNWTAVVPLGAATNTLQIVGRDLRGNIVPGATDTITIRYSGVPPVPQDWVVFNEIMYRGSTPNSEFVEFHNRHPSYTFDLSGFRLSGLNFTFPAGTLIGPNGYLVIAENRADFAAAYGSTIPVAGEYGGNLDNDGEMLRLIKPGATEAEDIVIDDVRYEAELPWPVAANGLGSSLQLIDAAQDNWPSANWAATPVTSADRATPGRANSTRNTLEPFAAVRLNEVLPQNLNGQADNLGEREPWIELFNPGAASIDLSAFTLSDDAANLGKWRFPAGTVLGAGQYMVVWADGEPSESTGAALHTSFRLNPTNGVVALSRTQLGASVAFDHIRYNISTADRSWGSVPDGEPRRRRLIYFPTMAAANNPAAPGLNIYFNEWMASNTGTLLDPANGRFEDWFELYNAGTNTVDLSGYYLSDTNSNPTQFRIPVGVTIPPGGFRLFWAAGDATLNGPGLDIQTNFRLDIAGEQLVLSAPDGTVVDTVTFGAQNDDISNGRFPDGAAAPFQFFTKATPGQPNAAQFANQAPVINPVSPATVTEGQALQLQVTATDPDTPAQTLTFSLVNPPAGAAINATGLLTWTPSEEQGPATYGVTIRVTDNGSPVRFSSRTITVNVLETNQPPVLSPIADRTVEEGVLFTFTAAATDPDQPAQSLTFSLDAGAPEGASIEPRTGLFTWTPLEQQGPGMHTIQVRVTDDGPGQLSHVRTVRVAVVEINNPPVIASIQPQGIDELAPFSVQIVAADPETPPAKLTYSIQSGPEGATINADTGLFSWTPKESDGPQDYSITVRVTEAGGLSSTMSFVLGVKEVNSAPVLSPIPTLVVRPGDTLNYTNQAVDLDLPAQQLRFSAPSPLPFGANLDSLTGVFTWFVLNNTPNSTNNITIRVTDDAIGELFAEQTFQVIVSTGSRLVASLLADGRISVSWNTTSGVRYRLEATTSLSSPNWQTVSSAVASGQTMSHIEPTPLASAQRFYRVISE